MSTKNSYLFDQQFGIGQILSVDGDIVTVIFPNIQRKAWYRIVNGLFQPQAAVLMKEGE